MRSLEASIPGATNFTYKEFVRSNTATRFNIPNKPNEKQWRSIEYLAKNVLQSIRNKFGRIRVTSGFRSYDLNKKIGGSTTSFHSHGQAADIIPLRPGITNLDLLKYIHDNLNFTELIYEYGENGWIHVGLAKGRGQEKTLKIKDENHDYEKVSLEYIITGKYKRK